MVVFLSRKRLFGEYQKRRILGQRIGSALESDADSRWQESYIDPDVGSRGVLTWEVICNSEPELTAAFNIEVTLELRGYQMMTGNMQDCSPPGRCDKATVSSGPTSSDVPVPAMVLIPPPILFHFRSQSSPR